VVDGNLQSIQIKQRGVLQKILNGLGIVHYSNSVSFVRVNYPLIYDP
jgi:hypothetical protein